MAIWEICSKKSFLVFPFCSLMILKLSVIYSITFWVYSNFLFVTHILLIIVKFANLMFSICWTLTKMNISTWKIFVQVLICANFHRFILTSSPVSPSSRSGPTTHARSQSYKQILRTQLIEKLDHFRIETRLALNSFHYYSFIWFDLFGLPMRTYSKTKLWMKENGSVLRAKQVLQNVFKVQNVCKKL